MSRSQAKKQANNMNSASNQANKNSNNKNTNTNTNTNTKKPSTPQPAIELPNMIDAIFASVKPPVDTVESLQKKVRKNIDNVMIVDS